MRVWVFQTGEYLPYLEPGHRPMRAANLVTALEARGHEVTLWTADFNHYESRHRFGRHTIHQGSPTCQIRLVNSPGYSTHVGVGRLVDHAALGYNLWRLLRNEKPPDVAVIGYPPIEPAAALVGWLRKRDIPVLLDVKDQWPETFLRPVPEPLHRVARAAMSPYAIVARRAMREATGLVSITTSFLRWAREWSGRDASPYDHVAYLVPQQQTLSAVSLGEAAHWWDQQGVFDDGRPRAIYVGAIDTLTDAEPVLHAAAHMPHWQFVVAGEGPERQSLVLAADRLPNLLVPGWIDSAQAQVLHQRSTATLIPYRTEPAFLLSLPNKTFDSLAAGLPILTGLEGELGSLISSERVGFVYSESRLPLETALERLGRDVELRQAIRERCLRLYESRFTFEKVYGAFVDVIESTLP